MWDAGYKSIRYIFLVGNAQVDIPQSHHKCLFFIFFNYLLLFYFIIIIIIIGIISYWKYSIVFFYSSFTLDIIFLCVLYALSLGDVCWIALVGGGRGGVWEVGRWELAQVLLLPLILPQCQVPVARARRQHSSC